MIIPQYSPNRWSCLPVSFAMVANIDFRELVSLIGHDGSEIIYPDLEEPLCRRSFHHQEIVDVLFRAGRFPILIEAEPMFQIPGKEKVPIFKDHLKRLNNYLEDNEAVLIGITEAGKRHAVAWDKKEIIDPSRKKIDINTFTIEGICLII